jgi:hypothetical protein
MADVDYNKLAHEYGVSAKGAEALDKRFKALENKNSNSNESTTANGTKTQSF